MNEEDTGLAIAGAALDNLPTPIKTSFLKAASDLLGGLTAVPAAWLRQKAQSIEDTTVGRSTVAASLAKATAEEVRDDPLLMQAAVEVYVPSVVRKVKNRISVAQSAAAHLAQEASTSNGNAATPPDDDWMNSFMRFAEDASSDRLRDFFGRILAGQIVRPGAFCLTTLRTLSELDQPIATDFQIAWTRSVGEAVDHSEEWHRGEGFARWKRLSEAGLIAPSATAQFLPPFVPVVQETAIWTPMSAGGTFLNVHFLHDSNTVWDHIAFTRVGREIGSLLAQPDYAGNMRAAALRLSKSGVTFITLAAGGTVEVIWSGS